MLNLVLNELQTANIHLLPIKQFLIFIMPFSAISLPRNKNQLIVGLMFSKIKLTHTSYVSFTATLKSCCRIFKVSLVF